MVIIVVALETGIFTTGVTLAAAVVTAVADQAALILCASAAVRAMLAGLNGAVLAQLTVFTIIGHTVRARAAFLAFGAFITDSVALSTVRTSHVFCQVAFQAEVRSAFGAFAGTVIAFAALIAERTLDAADTTLRAVTVRLHSTVDAHPAVITPFGRAETAAAAIKTLYRVSNSIALSAVGAGHIFCQVALETEMVRSLRTFAAAVVTEAALVAEGTLHAANAAVPAVTCKLHRTIDTHLAVFAPIAGAFAFSASDAMMLVAAAVAGSAVVAMFAKPVVVAPRAAVFTFYTIFVARIRHLPQRQQTHQHQAAEQQAEKPCYSCFLLHVFNLLLFDLPYIVSFFLSDVWHPGG